MTKSKVIFKFDKEKDLYNIWHKCNAENPWHNFKENLPPKVLKIAEGKKYGECEKNLQKHFKKFHSSNLINITGNYFGKAWNQINDEYFKRLKKIMKKPICAKKFTGYITTIGFCPYGYNKDNPWFMVSFNAGISRALCMAGHEIMHIQFHNTYWNDVEKQIGKEKTADLKEALTILLDLEFKNLWFTKDNGKECHKILREYISKEWKKKPDFDVLLDKCIRYMKK